MAASVWSGYLTFGLISMPVRLFSGARSSGISFNQLHRTDHQRVKQQLVCSADGQVLDRADIVKGYEYRKGEYVIIDPEEIKKIEPKTAKTMEILEFVKSSVVDPDAQVLDRAHILKGYEYRKGEYVIIDPEEIKKIEPKTAKTMEILEFVKSSEVDPVYFESYYYMVPEEAGRRPYALLTKALEESEYVAIAKLTMHNREYTVFLR